MSSIGVHNTELFDAEQRLFVIDAEPRPSFSEINIFILVIYRFCYFLFVYTCEIKKCTSVYINKLLTYFTHLEKKMSPSRDSNKTSTSRVDTLGY